MKRYVVGAMCLLAVVEYGCASQPLTQDVGPGDASLGPPSGVCATLGACCPTLPTEVVTSCNDIANGAASSVCANEVAALQAAGRCHMGADGGSLILPADATVADAGMTPADSAAGDASAVACVLLTPCCSSGAIPAGDVATCMSVEGAGVESTCVGLLNSLTASGSCGGTSPNACPELQQCCSSASFPTGNSGGGDPYMACQSVLEMGDPSGCESNLTAFMSAGFCGGSVPTGDGGQLPDPNCTMLETECCEQASFPVGMMAACQMTVAANNGGNCSNAYAAYVALNYCD
jgi:hypothetical protein